MHARLMWKRIGHPAKVREGRSYCPPVVSIPWPRSCLLTRPYCPRDAPSLAERVTAFARQHLSACAP